MHVVLIVYILVLLEVRQGTSKLFHFKKGMVTLLSQTQSRSTTQLANAMRWTDLRLLAMDSRLTYRTLDWPLDTKQTQNQILDVTWSLIALANNNLPSVGYKAFLGEASKQPKASRPISNKHIDVSSFYTSAKSANAKDSHCPATNSSSNKSGEGSHPQSHDKFTPGGSVLSMNHGIFTRTQSWNTFWTVVEASLHNFGYK